MRARIIKALTSPAISAVITLSLGLVVGIWMAEPPAGGTTPAGKMAMPAGHHHGPPPPKTGAPAGDGETAAADAAAAATAEAAQKTLWTCSMHPQIKLPEAGKCPICGMDLIPLKRRAPTTGGLQISMSAAAIAAAHIETTVVKREAVTVPVRMVGKVTYDETRVSRITAWFGGRIERTYVDFTGTRVRKGDHLVSIYSPELLVAQSELIQAAKEAKRAPAGPFGDAARATKQAARDKLHLWGLMDWQIRQIGRRGRPMERVTIYAPMGGIVVHKNALEGAWVKTGTPLYTIADLTHVWVELDAYESDLAWLRYDQATSFEVAAFPGEQFKGRISFVNPTMDARTRTVKVRVDVANPDLRLKPEMFVRAQADVEVGAGHGPARTELAGKYICPMHPSEVADTPGKCSICGMKLVHAEDHWLVGPGLRDSKKHPPLVIPASAPLFTGRRVVVFVEDPDAKEPTYFVREVRLGARAGDRYLVMQGLKEGERVVTRGAFRLDSSMQIMGEASVMNHPGATAPEGAAEPTAADHAKAVVSHLQHVVQAVKSGRKRDIIAGAAALKEAAAKLRDARGLDQAIAWLVATKGDPKAAKRALGDVVRIVQASVPGARHVADAALPRDPKFAARLQSAVKWTLVIAKALAADNPSAARDAAKKLLPVAKALVRGRRPVNPWLLASTRKIMQGDATLASQRVAFEGINVALIPLTVIHAAAVHDTPYEQVWCPMAIDGKGAPWLQAPGDVANPYFGSKMIGCGGKIDLTPSGEHGGEHSGEHSDEHSDEHGGEHDAKTHGGH